MRSLRAALICIAIGAHSAIPAFAAESMDENESPAPETPMGVPSQPAQPMAPGAPPVAEQEREDAQVARPEIVPALQLTPDFVSPALAFGGYFPVPDVESGAIKLGPTTVRAGVNASMGYDDNVTLSSTDKRSSFLFTLTPIIAAGLEGAAHRYYAVYRGNYGWYTSYTANNYDDHYLTLSAADEWGTRLTTNVRYDFLRGHDPVGYTQVAQTAPAIWDQQRILGSASYGAAGAPARIIGDVTYVKREYTTNRDVTGPLDYYGVDLGLALSYRVAPKTNLLLRAVHTDITHPSDHTQDATEDRYIVGATWDALAKTQAKVGVGYMTRTPADPSINKFSAPTYEGGITWSPLTYSTFTLTARRSFAEAIDPGTRFIVVDFASVNWQHAWSDRVRSNLAYIFGRQEYQGVGRADTYQSIDARVSYGFARRLRFGAQYRHDARSSGDASTDYTRNLMLFTVESSL